MKIYSCLFFLIIISMIISCNVQNQSDGDLNKSNDISRFPELKGHIRSFTSKSYTAKFVKGKVVEDRFFKMIKRQYDKNGFLLSRNLTFKNSSQIETYDVIYSFYYFRDDEYKTKNNERLIENMNDNEVITVRTFQDNLEVKVDEYEKGLKIEETSKFYTDQKELSKEIHIYYSEDKTTSSASTTHYFYDENSNLIKTETYSNGDLIQNQKMEFKDNKMVKRIRYSSNTYPEHSSDEFIYYPSGIIKERVHIGYKPHKILYDQDGKKEMIVTNDESPQKLCIYSYKYDHLGNWVERTKDYTLLARKINFNSADIVIEERTFEYY